VLLNKQPGLDRAGVVHSCGAIAGAAAVSTHTIRACRRSSGSQHTHDTCVLQGFEGFEDIDVSAVLSGLFPCRVNIFVARLLGGVHKGWVRALGSMGAASTIGG
jgi:hypothetical protein